MVLVPDPHRRLVWLRNDRAELAVLPDLGGRITHFRLPGQINSLLFDDGLLKHRRRPRQHFPADCRFRTYNGHIVWLAPQRDWWQQQDLNPGRKARGNPWPPDPAQTQGAFTVRQHSATRCVLEGPVSAISGMQLRKDLRLAADGSLHARVLGVNRRETPVAWALWCNTRVSGYARAWVPVAEAADCRIEGSQPLAWSCTGGWFHFTPFQPRHAAQSRAAKAFLTPRQQRICAFTPGGCLQIDSAAIAPTAVAPTQAPIEIYQHCTPTPASALLELEMQGRYRRLMPGACLRMAQVWRLHACPRRLSTDAQAAFVAEL